MTPKGIAVYTHGMSSGFDIYRQKDDTFDLYEWFDESGPLHFVGNFASLDEAIQKGKTLT